MLPALLCLAALLIVPAAQAQTQTLISNTGQSGGEAGGTDFAQAFTTGGHAAGYTLKSVDLVFIVGAFIPSGVTVTIHNENNGIPGTLVGTLTTPSTAPAGKARFAAPGQGLDLAAGATYFIVADNSSLSVGYQTATSGNEDSGGASGWSIADKTLWRRGISPDDFLTSKARNYALKIAVNGVAKTAQNLKLTVNGFGSATQVNEGGTAAFTVTLSGNTTSNLSIPVRVKATSQAKAADLVSPPAAISIASGTNTGTANFNIALDAVTESDETLTIEVHDLPVGVTLAQNEDGEDDIVIKNVVPTLTVNGFGSATQVNEGETATFTVTLPGNVSSNLSIPVRVKATSQAKADDLFNPPPPYRSRAEPTRGRRISISRETPPPRPTRPSRSRCTTCPTASCWRRARTPQTTS